MAKQTKVDAELERQSHNLLKRLGYKPEQVEQAPGLLREARELLGQVYSRGRVDGYREGHAHGWEDRGREPTEDNLPRRKYQAPEI